MTILPSMRHFSVIILAFLCFVKINAQGCGQLATCGECMSDSSCQWCSDPDFNGDRCTSACDLDCCSECEYGDDCISCPDDYTYSTGGVTVYVVF